MSKNFDLASIIPDELTFTDSADGGDGRTYSVLSGDMLSPEQHLTVQRMQKEVLAFADEPEGGTDHTARIFEQRMTEFFAMLIPDLPPERVARIRFGLKARFVDWWADQQGAAQKKQETTTPLPRQSRPSPASSRPTGSRRKK